MSAPVSALASADGTNTAVLAEPAGFGTSGFGDTPFGGWFTTVDAVLVDGSSSAALLPAEETATLAGNGVSTAVASETPVTAELQLV